MATIDSKRTVDHIRYTQTNAAISMYHSLLQAVEEAGGATDWLSPDQLEKMTATELISYLAVNKIIFVYGPSVYWPALYSQKAEEERKEK